MISHGMSIVVCLCLFSADEALDKARLKGWLFGEENAVLIIQTFRRHPDDVLPFIDEYLESGLKMIEEGEEHQGTSSLRTGVRFAKLADKAFGGTAFTEYAASFASWSPAERRRFREGQKEYRAGREAMNEPVKALAHFEKALKLAEPLGDTWGTAMALGGMAEALLKLDRRRQASERAGRAVGLNEQLKLRKAQIATMLTMMEARESAGGGLFGGYGDVQRIDLLLLREEDQDEYRRSVAERCIRILEKDGQTDEAEKMKKRYGLTAAPATQPAKD